MGRSPLPQPQKFIVTVLNVDKLCGISTSFPVLSPAEGQVSYVLRTRSPLTYIAACPFDLHVLGTPPAFILSQDQTLRIFVHPKVDVSNSHTVNLTGFRYHETP